ncbi:MAG: preprotein translocase subunit SecG [Candidatus Dadabacteria bacterium]|nr:preprotein translocase subunit SecG [Candidatus Dadabacteria bacterium]
MEIVILAVKVLHIIVSILLILVVLLQPGKSGDLGSIFGGGTSESIFGSSGAVPFLAKVTRGLAVLFFLTSLSLGYFAMGGGNKSVISDIPAPVTETAPVDNGDGGMSTEGGAATEGAAPEGGTLDAPADPGAESAPSGEAPAGDGGASSGTGNAPEPGQNP